MAGAMAKGLSISSICRSRNALHGRRYSGGIVLNLGVPSRMNIGNPGTHLAGAKGLGAKIGKMLEAQHAVWNCASSWPVYNETGGQKEDIKSMSDAESSNSPQLEEGVPMATPCSTARAKEIKDLLTLPICRPRPDHFARRTHGRAVQRPSPSATCTC